MVRYLRAANVKSGVLDLTDVKLMNFTPTEQQLFALHRGDVLVTEGAGSLNAIGASAMWNEDLPGLVCFQNTLVRLRPRRSITDARFLDWWAQHAYGSGAFASIAAGVNIFHLGSERVGELPAAFPSLAAQQAIADFLDVETARIDGIVSKRERQIELGELRTDVAVKERLSKVGPLTPLRRTWRVIDCKHRTPTYVANGYPVVSPGDVTPGVLDLRRCHRYVDRPDFDALTEGRSPRRGDIIYSRNASIGIAAYVDTDEQFTMGQDVCLITSPSQSQRYLTHVLNTLGLDQLEQQKIGSTFSRVNISQILDLLVPLPTRDDQIQIASQIDSIRVASGKMTDARGRQVALLRERRQALITAAVTGEIDVSTASGRGVPA